MQIMPATRRAPGVGDIVRVDASVPADVKYMRILIDRFYEDEPPTKLDGAVFVFVCYDTRFPGGVHSLAGRLQREAAKPRHDSTRRKPSLKRESGARR